MARLVSNCPACSSELKVTRLSCASCQMQLDGQFEVPPLLQLPPDELEFVVEFVKHSGSLKEMAALRGLSYPTIRNQLDAIIARLKVRHDGGDRKRHEILDAIAKGQLSAKQGAKRLKELGL